MANTHTGGCHCGAVRFEVTLEPSYQAASCNCSICMKLAHTSVIVKPEAFRLLAGEGSITSYAWAAKISTRYFCKTCGIYTHAKGHLEILGGDYVSVNLNCLDDFDVNAIQVAHWDGRHDNWKAGPRSAPWPLKS